MRKKHRVTDFEMRRMLAVHIQSMSIDKLEVLAQMIITENIYYDPQIRMFRVDEWKENDGQRSYHYST